MNTSCESLDPSSSNSKLTTTRHVNSARPRLTGLGGILAVALVALGGCSRNAPVPKAEDAKPVNPEAPPATQHQALVAQAVAMRSGVEPPKPAIQLRGGEPATAEVLAAYNQELARKIFQQRDAPETLEELVRRWQMPRLPTPPAGKRIVYDPVNRIIKLDPP